MAEGVAPLPEMVMLSNDIICQKLHARETSDDFWRLLAQLLTNVAGLLSNHAHKALSRSLLVPACDDAGLAIHAEKLLEVCRCAESPPGVRAWWHHDPA